MEQNKQAWVQEFAFRSWLLSDESNTRPHAIYGERLYEQMKHLDPELAALRISHGVDPRGDAVQSMPVDERSSPR
jgi:hypothetical protein